MVRNGLMPAIPALRYQAGLELDGGVEASTFARLRTIPTGSEHLPVRRTDFHVLSITGSGQGAATVDFVRHHPEPGTIAWIRPGRVHRWDDIAGADGTLVLFRPESVPHGSPGAGSLGPATWRQPESPVLVRLAPGHLRREHDAARARPSCDFAAKMAATLHLAGRAA